LLYDEAALTAAEALVRGLGWDDAIRMRTAVPREGLGTRFGSGTLRDLARDVVSIAGDGLRARNRIAITMFTARVTLSFCSNSLYAAGRDWKKFWLTGLWLVSLALIFEFWPAQHMIFE
jgi:gamma-glutamylcysteine synthetase